MICKLRARHLRVSPQLPEYLYRFSIHPSNDLRPLETVYVPLNTGHADKTTPHMEPSVLSHVIPGNPVCAPQDHVPAPAAGVQVDPRGHGARERARRQHRDVRTLRIRHQLEQGHRSVSTIHIPDYYKELPCIHRVPRSLDSQYRHKNITVNSY